MPVSVAFEENALEESILDMHTSPMWLQKGERLAGGMPRRINRGEVFTSLIAWARTMKGKWLKASDVTYHLKISDSYARSCMRMIGENEEDFEFHKGELRWIPS